MLSLCAILLAHVSFSMDSNFEIETSPKLNKVNACFISTRSFTYSTSPGFSIGLGSKLNATPLKAIDVDKNIILNGIVQHTNDSNLVEDEEALWIVSGPTGLSYQIGVISQTPEKSLFAQWNLNKKEKRTAIRLALVYWNQDLK
jgi:hypothetical protein